MQRLARIATEIAPRDPDSQSRLERRLNISDWEERRAALVEIFFLDRASAQYESRDVDDLDALVQMVIPQTRSIPVKYLPECYVVALEARQAGDNFQIRGVELLNAWKVIRGRVEMESKGAYENKTRLLTSNARGACSRCFGTNFERMPDGSVRPNCPHDQWTEEDELTAEESEAERREFVRKQAEIVREALKKVAGPKPPVPNMPAPPPPGHWLQCDACPNRVNVLYLSEGQSCGALLGRYEGDPHICKGTLRPVVPAEGEGPSGASGVAFVITKGDRRGRD